MSSTQHKLFPELHTGDRVCINQTLYNSALADRGDYFDAIEGSIGTIVSFDEYHTEYGQLLLREGAKSLAGFENYFLGVKKKIEKGLQYPVRFQKVIYPSNAIFPNSHFPKDGEIGFIERAFLEKIE